MENCRINLGFEKIRTTEPIGITHKTIDNIKDKRGWPWGQSGPVSWVRCEPGVGWVQNTLFPFSLIVPLCQMSHFKLGLSRLPMSWGARIEEIGLTEDWGPIPSLMPTEYLVDFQISYSNFQIFVTSCSLTSPSIPVEPSSKPYFAWAIAKESMNYEAHIKCEKHWTETIQSHIIWKFWQCDIWWNTALHSWLFKVSISYKCFQIKPAWLLKKNFKA